MVVIVRSSVVSMNGFLESVGAFLLAQGLGLTVVLAMTMATLARIDLGF